MNRARPRPTRGPRGAVTTRGRRGAGGGRWRRCVLCGQALQPPLLAPTPATPPRRSARSARALCIKMTMIMKMITMTMIRRSVRPPAAAPRRSATCARVRSRPPARPMPWHAAGRPAPETQDEARGPRPPPPPGGGVVHDPPHPITHPLARPAERSLPRPARHGPGKGGEQAKGATPQGGYATTPAAATHACRTAQSPPPRQAAAPSQLPSLSTPTASPSTRAR
jgi:hypothetical protein